MRLLSLFSLFACGAVAAQSVVVPSRASIRPPDSFSSASWILFGLLGPSMRMQFLYDTKDVPVPAGVFHSMSLRRSDGGGNLFVWNMGVQMSVGPARPDQASQTFATNHGPNLTSVFTGPCSFPSRALTGWPQPWEAPLMFMAPFVYLGPIGNSLVVDMACVAQTTTDTWDIEVYGYENGTASEAFYQPTCLHSGGAPVGGVASDWSYNPYKLAVGGSFIYQLIGYPNNQQSLRNNVLCFGATGPGGTWGGLQLPFPLASVGIAAPANCQWGVDVLWTLPLTYLPSPFPNRGILQSSVNSLPIPYAPALARATFFTQIAALDTNPVTNQPEVFPSHVVRWAIGAGGSAPYATVWNQFSATATTGQVNAGDAASLKFN